MQPDQWLTLILKPGERRGRLVTSERTLPSSIMINSKGKRFADEAMDYDELTKEMLSFDREYGLENVPAYLIFDSRFLSKYRVGGEKKESALKRLKQGDTIEGLAAKLRVDGAALRSTSEFNGYAETGTDPTFHRGESYYDRHWGDPSAEHSTLGEIAQAPFYGVRILAGDIGTKGGMLTDELGRVLDGLGKVIEGLYAVGNNAASIMGPGYAGSGATLGPAITSATSQVRNLVGPPPNRREVGC